MAGAAGDGVAAGAPVVAVVAEVDRPTGAASSTLSSMNSLWGSNQAIAATMATTAAAAAVYQRVRFFTLCSPNLRGLALRSAPVVVLETERLLLRRWRPEDREPFAGINADATVTRHLGGTPLTAEESDALVDRIEAHWEEWGYGLSAVEPKGTGRMIGFIGLGHHRALPTDVEIGWRLASDVWVRGSQPKGRRRRATGPSGHSPSNDWSRS